MPPCSPRPPPHTHTVAVWLMWPSGRCFLPLARKWGLLPSVARPSPCPRMTTHTLQVKKDYFKGLIEAGRITEEDLPQCIFASKPASGGAVLTLKL